MILSIILALLSGLSMSIQGVFNTRLSEKIGLWESIVIVQGTEFFFAAILSFFLKNGSYKNISSVNKLYLLGGLIGVIITFTGVKSIASMGATLGISIILVSQLVTAAVIDAFGLFGNKQVNFGFKEIISILIMIFGIILFMWYK